MTRVVLVCGRFRPERDGVAHYGERLRDALAAQGLDVAVAAAGGRTLVGGAAPRYWRGASHDDPDEPDAHALPVTDRWDAAGAARAAAALSASGADVVHVQWAPTAYGDDRRLDVLADRLRGPRLVTTLHEYEAGDAQADALVAASSVVVVTNPAHRALLVTDRPVRHVPIGVNVDVAAVDRAAARAVLGVPAEALVVAFFGFVHPVKGIRYLLPAFARLRAARPDARLVLAGGFESLALPGAEAAAWRAEVEELVVACGLAGVVTVTGWLPDAEVSAVLAAADVGVLPFTAGTTTKSGAVLTLAAHGVPLVVTRADPPDPALADGEVAVLVDRRDADGLAAGIARVLDDPALAARLRTAGHRLAAARSWPAIATAHLAVYGLRQQQRPGGDDP